MNRAQSIKAEAKTQVLSSAEREAIAAAISRSASASAGAAQINEPVVQAISAGTTLLVLNVEFISEAARLNFHLAGATVFAAAGPFAQMFVKPTDEVLEALVSMPGIRRIEPEKSIQLPPPLPLPAGVPSRGLNERVVSGGISGLTRKGVIFCHPRFGAGFHALILHQAQWTAAAVAAAVFLGHAQRCISNRRAWAYARLSIIQMAKPIGTLYSTRAVDRGL